MADVMVTLQKLANENTAKTFKFNKEEAATSRKWQEQMSNTAHVREVKDLIAAGLNPVLSSGGSGAQSYSTSSASGVADSAVNAIGSVESSRNSAAATRYAADQSLKAAQAAAAAQRYAADRAYASVMDRPQTTVWGVVDKYAGKVANAFGKQGVDQIKSFVSNPAKNVFKDNIVKNGQFQVSNKTLKSAPTASLLTTNGRRSIQQFLMSHGYSPSEHNIRSVIMFMNDNSNALYDLTPLDTFKNSAKVFKRFSDSFLYNRAMRSGY